MIQRIIQKYVIEKCGDDIQARRLRCGRLSGAVGISLNMALGLGKFFIGFFTGSVAVMADAVNNLSDAIASVITIIGFSLANRKSDKEHPFGHARYEYMTGVVVSALVIVIGVQLVLAGYRRIVEPEPLITDTVFIILLIVMTLVKIWLFRFNIGLGKLINSASLKATGIDSRNDAIVSVAALGAILLFRFAGVNIDGHIGLAVGIFVIYSGLNMVKETAGPLLGQSPAPETVREIADLVLGHEGVLGIHDLIVHDYGPGHIFASVHIEVDAREDIFKSHSLVDDIEMKALKELRVMLVGHMDPLDTANPKIPELREALSEALAGIKGMQGIHDLRIVAGPESTNVIFDVIASHDEPEETFKKVEKRAREVLSGLDPAYVAVINRDLDYGSNRESAAAGEENGK